jgi:hypothetical protein
MTITIHIPHWWPYVMVGLGGFVLAWLIFVILMNKALGPIIRIIEDRFGRW